MAGVVPLAGRLHCGGNFAEKWRVRDVVARGSGKTGGLASFSWNSSLNRAAGGLIRCLSFEMPAVAKCVRQ